jgi:hypothetical protein
VSSLARQILDTRQKGGYEMKSVVMLVFGLLLALSSVTGCRSMGEAAGEAAEEIEEGAEQFEEGYHEGRGS